MALEFTGEEVKHIKGITDRYMTDSIGMLYGERAELSGYFVNQCITKDNTVTKTTACLDLKETIDDLSAARATLYDIRTSIYETIGYQAAIPYKREESTERMRDVNNILEYKL